MVLDNSSGTALPWTKNNLGDVPGVVYFLPMIGVSPARDAICKKRGHYQFVCKSARVGGVNFYSEEGCGSALVQ